MPKKTRLMEMKLLIAENQKRRIILLEFYSIEIFQSQIRTTFFNITTKCRIHPKNGRKFKRSNFRIVILFVQVRLLIPQHKYNNK